MDDIVSRFAGVYVNDSDKQWENDFRRNRAETEWEYAQKRMAREDAAGQREAARVAEQDSVFSKARKDLDSGSDNPGSVAYMYPTRMAEIKTLVRGGRLEEANEKMQALKASADTYNATYRSFASTRPNGNFETAVNAGGTAMSMYQFWDVPMQMEDGTTVVSGDLFRDGKAYKTYQAGRLVRSEFSQGFADAYQSAEPFKRRVLSMISDPVTSPSQSVAFSNVGRLGTAGAEPVVWTPDASDLKPEYRPQHTELGNYVAEEWDSLVQELGERGTERLVQDAVRKRIPSGTAMDVVRNVRDWVSMDRKYAAGEYDGYEAVCQFLGQYDRMMAHSSGGTPTGKECRLYSRVMTAVIDGQKKEGALVDFDDPETRGRMDELVGVFRKAEDLGIPLLVGGNELGVNMRSAMSDFVRGASDSNFILRVGNMMDVTGQMLMSGWVPNRADSGKLSSGNASVDAMTKGVWSEFAKACLSRMASGRREDIAMSEAASDPSVVEKFADRISASGGLSRKAASYVASAVSESIRSGGGVRPVNLRDVIVKTHGGKDVDPEVKRELLRWYKGTELAADVMEPDRAGYMALLTDKTIGPGLSPESAAGAWADVLKQAASYMEHGVDPHDPKHDPFGRLMHTFSVYEPTGRWVSPDGTWSVSPEQYEKYRKAVTGGRGAVTHVAEDGTKIVVSANTLGSLRPEVQATNSVDIRTREIRGIPGWYGGFGKGAWTDPANRTSYLKYQAFLKSLLEAQQRRSEKSAERSSKAAFDQDNLNDL